jgi:hypothetical protein
MSWDVLYLSTAYRCDSTKTETPNSPALHCKSSAKIRLNKFHVVSYLPKSRDREKRKITYGCRLIVTRGTIYRAVYVSYFSLCLMRLTHRFIHSTSTNRPTSHAFFAAFCSASISPLISHMPLKMASLPSFFSSSYGCPYSTTQPLSSTNTLS